MNKAQLSKAIGKPVKVIDDWLALGCPYQKLGGQYKFDMSAVWKWREGYIRNQSAETATATALALDNMRSLNKDAEQARVAKENADRLQMDNALRRGELADLAEVEKAWLASVLAMRSRLLNIPSKAAPDAFQGESVSAVQAIIENHILEALDELSRGDIGSESAVDDGQQGSESPEAPPKDDNKPVGRRKTKTKPRSKRGTRKVANK